MFLNTIVSIGCTIVIFHSHKPTESTNQPEVQTNRKYKPTGGTNQPEVQTNRKHKNAALISRYPEPSRWKQHNKWFLKKTKKTKSNMHNTVGDVALTKLAKKQIFSK